MNNDRMTEQKAREILKDCAETFARQEDKSICSDEAEHAYAQGYLEALEDERAKAKGLVEALENIKQEMNTRCANGYSSFTFPYDAEKALARYKGKE